MSENELEKNLNRFQQVAPKHLKSSMLRFSVEVKVD